ncbi:MAG: 2-succinyl-6-hydroxy-2,4-cyclohexadiene-1-carboxylate synthase [Raoultibacter sp.]
MEGLRFQGVNYHVRTWSEEADGVPLLLLHGFAQSSATWCDIAPQLAETRPVFALDFAGFGQSDKPKNDEPYRLETRVAVLDALISAIGAPVHLLGYSMGGRVALAYTRANAQAQRLVSLVLESAAIGPETPEERAVSNAHDALLAERLDKEDIASFVEYWENIPLFETQHHLCAEVRQRLHEERLDNSCDALARSVRFAGQHTMPLFGESLGVLPMPILYIAGMADEKYTKVAETFATCESATCSLLSAGHNVHVENPASFYDHVDPFLRGCDERFLKGTL